MRRLCPSLRSSLIGLFLGLLLVAVGGEPHTATAQAPSFDSDQPVQSLKQATAPAESDSALVALATALQKARADTEISFQEYKDGVRFFQQNHPGFYGNFFGDPFYATYDIRYSRLAWERQMAEPDINPPNGVGTNTWFFCHPFTYDPAFNGQCRGFTFAVSDFFHLPFGPAFTAARRSELGPNRDRFRDRRRVWEHTDILTWAAGPTPSESDTSRAPTEPRTPITKAPTADRSDSGRPASDANESTAPVEPEPNVDAMPTPDEISVPDEIATSERVARTSKREARTAPDRVEDISRVRALIRRQKNGDRLSAEERREVMSTVRRVAERQNARRVNSRNGRSDRLRQRVESQIDRDHEFTDRSPRPPSDADQPQTETDRSASEPPRSDRPEARPERSSSPDRSRTTDDSSDDEREN